jgi:hypothetical protein
MIKSRSARLDGHIACIGAIRNDAQKKLENMKGRDLFGNLVLMER